MTRDNKKKFRFPYFWVIYGTLTLAAVLAIAYGLNLLRGYLTEFESAQPSHPAEAVFQRYFAEGDFRDALALAGFQTGEFETLDHPNAVLKKMAEGKKLTYYSVPAGEGKAAYNVVLISEKKEESEKEETKTELPDATEEPQTSPTQGFTPLSHSVTTEEDTLSTPEVVGIPSTKIATFYLKQSAPSGEWGFAGYELESMELFLKPEKSISVTLPESSRLLINGKEVPASYVTASRADTFNSFLAEGIPGLNWVTYTVEGLFEDPALVEGLDRENIPHKLSFSQEKGIWEAALNYSQSLQDTYSEFLMAGMKEYAKHIQNDVRFSAVIPYFDPQSIFYRHIYENLSQFVWDHNGYTFRNEFIGEFYAFDENTFCCHVSFDHVLHLRNREDYVDPLDMIIFVHRVGDKFMIYDRYNAS